MFIFTQQEHFSEKYFLLAHYAIGKKSPLSFLLSATLNRNTSLLLLMINTKTLHIISLNDKEITFRTICTFITRKGRRFPFLFITIYIHLTRSCSNPSVKSFPPTTKSFIYKFKYSPYLLSVFSNNSST